MKLDLHVAAPPSKPLMIFDGDCDFCARWTCRWQQATGDRVEYLPFQDPRVAEQFPELSRENFATAVHFIEPDGAVFYGAEAAFRALAHNPARGRTLRWYKSSPAFANFTERAYRFVAKHRVLLSRFIR
jgi:lipase maturation factor 1